MLFKIRLFLVMLCLCLITAPGFADNYLPSIQHILAKGKLVVAINGNDSPPMFSKDSQGNLTGYDISLANYIGKHLGVPVEFVRYGHTFDDVVTTVNEGKADVGISLLTPNLVRARKVMFTEPYLYLNQTLIYNRLASAQRGFIDPANQIQNIKGLKIAILNGSSYVNYAKELFPQATLVLYPNFTSAMLAVEKGEVFGLFSNSVSISYWLKQDADAHLYLGVSDLKNRIDPIAIAVSWKYPDLVTWLNLALKIRQFEHLDSEFRNEYSVNKTMNVGK